MEPVVSIICNVYNHEDYIEAAIKGFLSQKCSFPFEVLIHDDCSTDGSADIIRRYAERYPDLIFPLIQTENKYSKGISITPEYQYPRVRGKYTAFCEGDDYWTDPQKLQRQVDALEAHPEADICTHGAVTVRDGKEVGRICPSAEKRIFTAEEVILGGGDFVATDSIMCRSEINENLPPFMKFLHIDYTIQIHGSLRGGMVYLPEVMSAYRVFSKGSWTAEQFTNTEKREAFREKYETMLKTLDDDTGGVYSSAIGRKLKESRYYAYGFLGDFKKMLSPEFKDIRAGLPLKNRIILRGKAMFPGMVMYLRRRRVRGRGGDR